MDAKILGRRIRAARIMAGLSREDLGELIDYSGDHVGAFERGAQTPRDPVIDRIALATDQPKVFFTDQYEGLLAAAEQQLRKAVPGVESK